MLFSHLKTIVVGGEALDREICFCGKAAADASLEFVWNYERQRSCA